MKNSLKIRLITILSTLVLCLTAFLCVNNITSSTVVFAEENSLITTQNDTNLVESWDISATTNDNVTANLYHDPFNEGNYVLNIIGTGNTKSYSSGAPWQSLYGNTTKNVIIETWASFISWHADKASASKVNKKAKTIANGKFPKISNNLFL